MELSPQQLCDVEFSEQWRGYNRDQVDDFIERVAAAVSTLQDRLRNKDTAAAAFLDLFQHRLLALLYRAQRKYRVADPFAEPEHSPAEVILRGIAGLQLRARHRTVRHPLDRGAAAARRLHRLCRAPEAFADSDRRGRGS